MLSNSYLEKSLFFLRPLTFSLRLKYPGEIKWFISEDCQTAKQKSVPVFRAILEESQEKGCVCDPQSTARKFPKIALPHPLPFCPKSLGLTRNQNTSSSLSFPKLLFKKFLTYTCFMLMMLAIPLG